MLPQELQSKSNFKSILTGRLAGNIILELNNRPAMPYLLSLLPPQSKEEELNPLPLVARVPSLDQGSILYVNVLGGSRSKGGIALDPLVASGHVSPDLKIEFGQVRQAYLPTFRPPNNSVHIQLEVLSHLSRRFKPGWEEHEGSDRFMHVGFRRKQRWHGVPEFTYNRRPDYQGTQIGLFAAGSEGGFMVGQAGMVPWLNRIRGARTQVQVTAIKERQRLEPVILKPKQPIDPKAHLAEVERKKQVRAYLKANNMIVSKRVEFVTHNRWRTVSFLRRKEVPWRLKQGLEKQKRRRVKYKLDAERQLEKKERMKRRLEMEQVRDRLMAKGAQIGFKSFVPFAGARALLRGGKPPRKSWSRLAKGNQSIVEKHPQPAKPDGRAREGFDFSSVSGYVTNLMATDQPVHDLLESGEIRIRKLFNMGSRDLRGPRRFGFRSRRFWQETRPGGFRRGGHRPGGLSFWGEKGPGRGKRQESEGQVADNARSR